MITTAIIAFREFLEAFLIAGVFFGISKKLSLHKEKEISGAVVIGVIFSILLSVATYFLSGSVNKILTHEHVEMLEGYLLVISGVFLAYVSFSLHASLRIARSKQLLSAYTESARGQFDIPLYITIASLVSREGMEIALFTASTSLFSTFLENVVGLCIGFLFAGLLAAAVYKSYLSLPISRIIKGTEWAIILLGAALVQNGITELFESQLHIELADLGALPLPFLPDAHSLLGHMLSQFTGIDQEFSVARLAIMLMYGGIVSLSLQTSILHKLVQRRSS